MDLETKKEIEKIKREEKEQEERTFRGFTPFERAIFKFEENWGFILVINFMAIGIATLFGLAFNPEIMEEGLFIIFVGIMIVLGIIIFSIEVFTRRRKLFERYLNNEYG